MLLEEILKGLYVFFISALPVAELRVGIPYGIGILGLNPIIAFIWAVLGNILPVAFLLKLLDPAVKFIFKYLPFAEKRLKAWFERLHDKHSMKFNEFGAIFLAIFVAVPLPGTGAWTGALLAYLFNIPFWLAFGSISLGVVGAGVLITFFSETVKWLL